MHLHTVDWLRNVEISADAALAEKRWKTAESYASGLDAQKIVILLRLFLFPKPESSLVSGFTEELLKIDPDFLVTGNMDLVRVMAGLVMATCFAACSPEGTALALGQRAARGLGAGWKPAVAGIAEEAESYLAREAEKLRPDDFSTGFERNTERLDAAYIELKNAEDGGDEAKIKTTREAYHRALLDRNLSKYVLQLAEETQLLWLAVGEFSPELMQPTANLSAASYALIVAAEVASRVRMLPPPPSIDAILHKALAPCKATKKKAVLAELLQAADEKWRGRQVAANPVSGSRCLLPLSAALEKMQELGIASQVVQSLPKLCPSFKADLNLTPADAARQYFAELSFLAALKKL